MKKQSITEIVVPMRIILIGPPMGVDFGIQERNDGGPRDATLKTVDGWKVEQAGP